MSGGVTNLFVATCPTLSC